MVYDLICEDTVSLWCLPFAAQFLEPLFEMLNFKISPESNVASVAVKLSSISGPAPDFFPEFQRVTGICCY